MSSTQTGKTIDRIAILNLESHPLVTPTHLVTAVDEIGQLHQVQVAEEVPLTLFVDDCELVTLMTLCTHPAALALGYLRTQGLIKELNEIQSVQLNWPDHLLQIRTVSGVAEWQPRINQRIVTTGCGHGTVVKHLAFGEDFHLPMITVKRSLIDAVLQQVNDHNEVYRQAGGVHGCALCQGTKILAFVEDVGRHNATDTMAGLMWLHKWSGEDKMFYTTGRLTAEMVMKVAQLGIPVLLSRSGVTAMGIQLAQKVGMTLIANARGQHFLMFNGKLENG